MITLVHKLTPMTGGQRDIKNLCYQRQISLFFQREVGELKKHIINVVKPNLKRDGEINCRECATSCQSACKTSCTVGNQICRKQ